MTTFRIAEHSVVPGRQVVEIHIDGHFVGQITEDSNTGSGIRFRSKHAIEIEHVQEPGALHLAHQNINKVTIRIDPR